MFDVGFSELVLIFVLALLVLGPERLPKVARTAGRWLGRARQMARSMQYELERELDMKDMVDGKSDTVSNVTPHPSYGTPPARTDASDDDTDDEHDDELLTADDHTDHGDIDDDSSPSRADSASG